MFRAALFLAALTGVAQASVSVTIKNSCSESISLYDNSATTTMAAGASTTRTLANGYTGMFRNGADDEATLAEFSVDSDGTPWYDISIIPPGSGSCTSYEACKELTGATGFNTAMQIAPQSNTDSTNCEVVTCLADACDEAYQYPSDDDNTHTCPSGTSFVVTFCPGGSGSSSSTTGSSTASSSESTPEPTTATATPTSTPEPTTQTPEPTTQTPAPTTQTPAPTTEAPTTAPVATTEAPTEAPTETPTEAPTTEPPTEAPTTQATTNAPSVAESAAGEADDGSFTLEVTEAPTSTPTATPTATTANVTTTSAPTSTAATSYSATTTTTTEATGTTTESSTSGSDDAETANTQSSGGSSSSVGLFFAAGACVMGIAAGGFVYTMRQKKKALEMQEKTPRDLMRTPTSNINVL